MPYSCDLTASIHFGEVSAQVDKYLKDYMFELSEENVRILTLYVQRMRAESIRSSIEGWKK